MASIDVVVMDKKPEHLAVDQRQKVVAVFFMA
jgi:hypothetical protein